VPRRNTPRHPLSVMSPDTRLAADDLCGVVPVVVLVARGLAKSQCGLQGHHIATSQRGGAEAVTPSHRPSGMSL
jgi:hypothetical protein